MSGKPCRVLHVLCTPVNHMRVLHVCDVLLMLPRGSAVQDSRRDTLCNVFSHKAVASVQRHTIPLDGIASLQVWQIPVAT
jgi:hypothetical protein